MAIITPRRRERFIAHVQVSYIFQLEYSTREEPGELIFGNTKFLKFGQPISSGSDIKSSILALAAYRDDRDKVVRDVLDISDVELL